MTPREELETLRRIAELEAKAAGSPMPQQAAPVQPAAPAAPQRKHGVDVLSRLFTPDIYNEEIDKSKELMRSDSTVDKLLGGLSYGAAPFTTVARGFGGDPVESAAETAGVPEKYIPTLGSMTNIAMPLVGVTNLPGTAAKAAKAAMSSMKGFDPKMVMAGDALPASDEIVGGLTENKDRLLKSAQRLKVKLTPGRIHGGMRQTMEEQAGKVPGLSKPTEKATTESTESYHRALGREMGLKDSPYLTTSDIEVGMEELSKVYKEILPQATIRTGTGASKNLAKSAAQLTKPFSPVVRETIDEADFKQLERIEKGILNGVRSGEVTGDDLKSMGTRIRQLTANKDLHHDVKHRLLGFKDVMEESTAKALDEVNPDLAQRLRENSKFWANASILKDVQTSSGSGSLGWVSGPILRNKVQARYGNTKKAGNFGELADIGKTFFQKQPDSGTADRIVSNQLLNMTSRIVTTGGMGATGLALSNLPTTAAGLATLWGLSKVTAAIYFKTPSYQKALAAAKTAGKTAAGSVRRPAALSAGIDSVLNDAQQ